MWRVITGYLMDQECADYVVEAIMPSSLEFPAQSLLLGPFGCQANTTSRAGSRVISKSLVRMRGRRRVCLPRRRGSSLLRRVSAGGRGAGLMPAVTVGGRMGARARGAHARLAKLAQARSPLERGDELKTCDVEERPLRGVSKMAATSNVSQPMSALEKSKVGTSVKRVAPGTKVSNEVVVISDEDEELQVSAEGGLVKD
ncbi:hypothetical protein NDU88_003608 [Pleurodeles waltl]|uniref:Uncharacterized protein n=1 Tax=Pleurodeles waltl TaxID=8319 RepID=A0AAV7QG35_PLEWA|nr:hypothetical protein NDU88_003608 [Pleurodeles waltl]